MLLQREEHESDEMKVLNFRGLPLLEDSGLSQKDV